MGMARVEVSSLIDTDLVQTHLGAASKHVTDHAGPIFRSETLYKFLSEQPPFESPLEAMFWIWWEAYLRTSYHIDKILTLKTQHDVAIGVEQFRLDFAIEPIPVSIISSGYWTPIAVELDGHAFHERTPEQVARRDRRDRALQFAGWRVFHYSFREFTTDPGRCVCEVMAQARDQWVRASAEREADGKDS